MKIEKKRKFEAEKKEAREKGEGMVDGLNQEQENVDDSAQAVEWEEQIEVGEEEKEEKEDRIVGKRQQKLSAELKSPYMSRGVEVKTSLTMLERKVSRALFSMRKDKYDVIYETGFGFLCMRATLETLLPSEYVSYDVVDNFGQLLNYEEQFRSKCFIHRFYCTTIFLPYVIHKDEDTTDAGRYEIFKFELENLLQKHNQPMSLQTIDMIFFPILQDKHFWVAACDLRRSMFLILDNSACGLGAPIKDKYIGMPESLCYCLAEYMKSVSHPKAVEMESVEIERADMSCRTKENKIDCGVFVMHHMESYKGQKMKSWDCELGIDGFHQQQALNKLRSKYATKMLMSNANLQKKKVLDEADEFALFSKVE